MGGNLPEFIVEHLVEIFESPTPSPRIRPRCLRVCQPAAIRRPADPPGSSAELAMCRMGRAQKCRPRARAECPVLSPRRPPCGSQARNNSRIPRLAQIRSRHARASVHAHRANGPRALRRRKTRLHSRPAWPARHVCARHAPMRPNHGAAPRGNVRAARLAGPWNPITTSAVRGRGWQHVRAITRPRRAFQWAVDGVVECCKRCSVSPSTKPTYKSR